MAIVNAQLKTMDTNIIDPYGENSAPYEGSVPQNKTYAITNILVCNPSNSDTVSFDMHLVPFNDPVDNNVTSVVKGLTLPPGETFTFDSERIILEEGDRVVMIADTASTFPNITANNIVSGRTYEIVTSGDTDFVSIGATDNNPGTIFTATGPSIGTGTATLSGYSVLAATLSYMEV